MSHYSIYNSATGAFTGQEVIANNEHTLRINTPDGCAAAEGQHDCLSKRVDLATGEVVDWQPPAPPDTDLETFEWDNAPKRPRWRRVLKTAGVAKYAREHRAALLAACDWVVARAAETGDPIPAEWRAYRKALRDVTDKPGFPHEITWPTPPA